MSIASGVIAEMDASSTNTHLEIECTSSVEEGEDVGAGEFCMATRSNEKVATNRYFKEDVAINKMHNANNRYAKNG